MSSDRRPISLLYSADKVERGIRLALEIGPVEAGRRLGIPAQTISNWMRSFRTDEFRAKEAFNVQDPDNIEGEIGPPIHWSERIQEEANEAGRDATYVRDLTVAAMLEGKSNLVSAGARFYSILIDKAQLLSGNATSRPETADEQRQKLFAVMQAALREKRSRAG